MARSLKESLADIAPAKKTKPVRGMLLFLALSMPVLLQISPAAAQVAPASQSSPKSVHATISSRIDERVKVLAKNLDLDESQQTAVKHILEQRQAEMLRLRTDPSIPASARMDHLRMIQDRTVERIRAVLNDEQKKKYDPLAVRKLQPAADQRSVEEWLKITSQQ